MNLPPPPHHPEPHTYIRTKCELEAINKYGQACFEEGRNSNPPLEPMTEVADRCAHKLAPGEYALNTPPYPLPLMA